MILLSNKAADKTEMLKEIAVQIEMQVNMLTSRQ